MVVLNTQANEISFHRAHVHASPVASLRRVHLFFDLPAHGGAVRSAGGDLHDAYARLL